VQKDLEQPAAPIIAESPRSRSSGSKIHSLREKHSPGIDSLSSLSKLESICTHSKRGESNFPLTDRQLNFLNGEEIAQMISQRGTDGPITERKLEHTMAPTSFRELLAGIAQNLHNITPR